MKTEVSILTLVTLGLIILAPLVEIGSAVTTSTTTFPSSGNIQYNLSNSLSSSIKKTTYAHGGCLTDPNSAEKFDLLVLEYGGRWDYPISTLNAIKAANPNIILIGYQIMTGAYTYQEDWNIINRHEDWFIHDIYGNRVYDLGVGWYLMDLGNAGWREHWITNVNNKLMQYPQYDGVFADNAFTSIPKWVDFNVPYSSFKSSDVNNWHKNTIEFIKYANDRLLSDKIIIINTDDWETYDYLNVADGMMIEGFAHATWDAPSDHTFNIYNVNFLSEASRTGKIVWYCSGTTIPSGTSSAQVYQIVKFTYAAALLSTNGPNTYFGFNSWESPDGSHGYYPIMDTKIGQPVGNYYWKQNILMRNFTNGRTLLNPSSTAYIITLDRQFKIEDGSIVTTIALPPWSGEVLTFALP